MDVLAHASMKDAAKCDTHCELQILVNHQISERIWRRWDFPAARLFQCLLILSSIISPQINLIMKKGVAVVLSIIHSAVLLHLSVYWCGGFVCASQMVISFASC